METLAGTGERVASPRGIESKIILSSARQSSRRSLAMPTHGRAVSQTRFAAQHESELQRPAFRELSVRGVLAPQRLV